MVARQKIQCVNDYSVEQNGIGPKERYTHSFKRGLIERDYILWWEWEDTVIVVGGKVKFDVENE